MPEPTWSPSTARPAWFQTAQWAGCHSGSDILLWWWAAFQTLKIFCSETLKSDSILSFLCRKLESELKVRVNLWPLLDLVLNSSGRFPSSSVTAEEPVTTTPTPTATGWLHSTQMTCSGELTHQGTNGKLWLWNEGTQNVPRTHFRSEVTWRWTTAAEAGSHENTCYYQMDDHHDLSPLSSLSLCSPSKPKPQTDAGEFPGSLISRCRVCMKQVWLKICCRCSRGIEDNFQP